LQELVAIMLASGRTALDLALYLLLPVMVIMLAMMQALEARGLLARVARLLAPPLRPFGIPGTGVFAMLQLLLVSFAGPIATLSVQDRDGTHQRRIAATLAMVLAMPQANVLFPMAAAGMNLGAVVLISLVGGLTASSLTYYVLTRNFDAGQPAMSASQAGSKPRDRRSLWAILVGGGQEGVQIVLNAIPALLLAIFAVNLLKHVGAIGLLENLLTPVLQLFGLPGSAVLPLATKYLAGGTAMMGVTLELIKQGTMTMAEFNRLAGFLITPLDMVGVSVLSAAGPRVAAIARPAVIGGLVGILVRGMLHLLLF
jgi:spore maturation protein SpmB